MIMERRRESAWFLSDIEESTTDVRGVEPGMSRMITGREEKNG